MELKRRAIEAGSNKTADSWYDIIMASPTFNITTTKTIPQAEALFTMKITMICSLFDNLFKGLIDWLEEDDMDDDLDQLCRNFSNHHGFLSPLCSRRRTIMSKVTAKRAHFCGFGGVLASQEFEELDVEYFVNAKWDHDFEKMQGDVDYYFMNFAIPILEDLPAPWHYTWPPYDLSND